MPLTTGTSGSATLTGGCVAARQKSGAMIGNGSSSRPLRFAVACRAGTVQAWQQRCIAALFAGGRAVWTALIETDGRSALSPALPPLFDLPSQRVAPIDVGLHDPVRVFGTDPTRLAEFDLDVVLCFDATTPRGLAGAARRGAWHFRFGGDAYALEPPCFWECYDGEAVVDMALLETAVDGGVSMLRAGAVAISATSLGASIDRALGEAAAWPVLACAALATGGVRQDVTHSRAGPRSSPGPRRANALFALLLRAKIVVRRFRRLFDVFYADKWNVGIARCSLSEFLTAEEWPRVDWLPEPPGLDYRADPFGASVGGRKWALLERFDGSSARGRIEAFEIAGGAWTHSCGEAMTAPAHMSYPFLLTHEDELYCIPETLGQSAVSLYRAVEMPSRWEKIATLIEGFDAVDATVVRYDGRWWLFCTDFHEPRHHRLHAFYAGDLAGPYVAHTANPVKIDPRSAGCAGTPFVADGSLYRPAQDCSRAYGGKVVLNRIVELTPHAFREETAAIVLPNARYPNGVHTLSSLGAMTLVDGKRRAFTLRRIGWRLIRRLRPAQAHAD